MAININADALASGVAAALFMTLAIAWLDGAFNLEEGVRAHGRRAGARYFGG